MRQLFPSCSCMVYLQGPDDGLLEAMLWCLLHAVKENVGRIVALTLQASQPS